jgi:acyl-CoA synthetase (NDP forming)
MADARPSMPLPTLPFPAPALSAHGYEAARAALASAGIAFAPARFPRDRGEALAAADELGYPVVVKAVGALHKSDTGGVIVGVRGAEALTAALDRLTRPWSVERMEDIASGFELLVGARRDPRFGPVVVVGAGGENAEILRDTRAALAPASLEDALRLIRELRCSPLLEGARGRPELDIVAAAEAVAALSRFAAEHPELAEIEVNPLLVRREGAVGLDARIVFSGHGR